MAQPTRYTPTTNFANDEVANSGGRTTVRADRVDAELTNVETTLDGICDNLGLIQRDDGELRDGIVSPESLSPTTAAMFGGSSFTPRGLWVTATAYAQRDLIEQAGVVYVCLVAHTSGVFATDRAAGRWQLFPGGQTAAAIAFAPTATITATDTQAAIVQVDTAMRSLALADYAFNYGGF